LAVLPANRLRAGSELTGPSSDAGSRRGAPFGPRGRHRTLDLDDLVAVVDRDADRTKSPVVQDDDHLLTVLRYIEANPLRAARVADAGDYAWSSFAAHGRGATDGLLDPLAAYEALADSPALRRCRWSDFVHRATPEEELAALRRSTATGLPFGATAWVERLGATLGLDLNIRPRGRPRKAAPDAFAAGAPAAKAGADDERR
jgi:hypothetical protein